MKKAVKITLISLITLLVAVAIIFGIAFSVLAIRTNALQDDYSFVYNDEAYSKAVVVDGIDPIKQDVSCGYAVIEMFSVWNGGNNNFPNTNHKCSSI